MVKVGIIGAMNEEVELLVKNMRGTDKTSIASLIFFSGELGGKPAVVVKCGIGKVNAAVCAQILISKFDVSHVIVTGVAGALDEKLGIGDVVVSSDCVQHDVDATALGCKPGQICFTDLRFFKPNKELIKAVVQSAKALRINYLKGRILTGDKFIADIAELKRLRRIFGGLCIEMEGAAVAHVCVLNDVPFVIIRSISDCADHSASVDFKKFLHEAAATSSSLVTETIKRLDLKWT